MALSPITQDPKGSALVGLRLKPTRSMKDADQDDLIVGDAIENNMPKWHSAWAVRSAGRLRQPYTLLLSLKPPINASLNGLARAASRQLQEFLEAN